MMKRQEVMAQMNSVRRFVGKLTKIQYASGQPCAQLVFETSQGPYLSLSRDIHLLQQLTIGKMYRVEGPKREVGGRFYWHEPAITPVRRWRQTHERVRLAGIAIVVGLSMVTGLLLHDQRQARSVTAESVPNHASAKVMKGGATVVDATQAAVQAVPPTEPTPTPGSKRPWSSAANSSSSSSSQPATVPSAPSDPGVVAPPATPPAATPVTPVTPTPTPPPTDPMPPSDPTPPVNPTPPADPPTDPTPPPTQP